jgi:tRNA A37 threonylcarbamoyladenosine synthetase subunit TsaC/SUA5/YrdC
MALATYKDLVIDASDARRLGAFWAQVLGRRLEENGPHDVVLRGEIPSQTVWVDPVPEAKAVKNRVHLDVHTADIDALVAVAPGLDSSVLEQYLPGPYTLVFGHVGVRVPNLPHDVAEVLRRAGPVFATSANLAGGPDPCRLDDVPRELREAAAAEIDGGELPGVASTVIDCTGDEPRVLREGAGPFEPGSILHRNPGEELAPWP